MRKLLLITVMVIALLAGMILMFSEAMVDAIQAKSREQSSLYFWVLPNGLECTQDRRGGGVTCNWARFNRERNGG